MKALELRLPPLLLVIAFASGMWAHARIMPGPDFTAPGARWLAAGIAIVGIFIAILGVLEFRSAGTTVDPRIPGQSSTLVVRGVYRFSRNPMYLGFLFLLIAWWLFLEDALAGLLLPVFILYMNRFQIAPEERHMQDKFGEAYDLYKSAVRRWI